MQYQQYALISEGPHWDNSQTDRSRYFFALMSFLVALIFLSTYLNNFDDLLSGWLPLLGTVAFAAIGVLFLVPNSILNRTKSPSSNSSLTESDPALNEAQTVDSFIEGEEASDARDTGDTQEADLSPFELLVEEALSSIPPAFHQKMENVLVQVQYEPDHDVMQRVGIKAGYTLLGLYEGVPLTAYGQPHVPHPEIITIYQHSIETYCHGKPDNIRQQVRHTVLHEVAHHFGIDHEEMPIWIQ